MTTATQIAPSAEEQKPRSELTASGEQLVIPGCERKTTPAVKQLSLWAA